MSVLDFIFKNPQLVVLGLSTIGGLLWHRNRSINLSDLWDTMGQLGRQVLPSLLKDSRLYDDAYVLGKIKEGIWAGLDRLKVKRTPQVESYVDEVAEHIKGELASKITDSHLGQFIATQSKTLDALKTVSQ